MYNNFSFNLKHIRSEKGLTREELGKLMGKDYSTIGKWENGVRTPIMEDVLKLAEVLNVEVSDLIKKNYGKDFSEEFSGLDQLMLSKFKKLSDDEKNAIILVIDLICKK